MTVANAREVRTNSLAWLQLLRGVGALAVVLYHFRDALEPGWPTLARWLNGGSIGVDIFFILSGFIICYSTQDVRTHDAAGFLVRRFSRIALPAWAAMALMAIKSQPNLTDLICGFLFILPQPAPPPYYGYGFLIVAWTLTYELYFYGVFALAISLSNRLGQHRAAVAATILVGIMLGLQAWLGSITLAASGSAQWRGLPSVPGATLLGVAANPMILEFLAGIALALVYQHWFSHAGRRVAVSVAIASSVVALIWFNGIVDARGEIQHGPLSAAGPSLLVVIAALSLQRLDDACFGGRALNGRVGRISAHLGDASYSLYLLHPIVRSVLLSFAARAGLEVGPWVTVAGVLISIFSALIFYRWIEVPSQNRGRRWASQLSKKKGHM